MDKVLLTPIEAAVALGIGRSKVYELLRSGALESVHIGRSRRVPTEAVHSFAMALRQSAQRMQTWPPGAAPGVAGRLTPALRADYPELAIGRRSPPARRRLRSSERA